MKKLLQIATVTAMVLLSGNYAAQAQSTTKPAQKPQPAKAATGKPQAAPATATAASPKQAPLQFKTYYIAILKQGPYQPKDTTEEKRIQAAHMAHMRKLAETGKLAMAGQIPEKNGLHAMFIFNVGSLAEAKAITDTDPAIKAGRFTLELHPWVGQRGVRLP